MDEEGEADDKQLKDEGGQEEDAQQKEDASNKNEPSVKRSNSSSTCKLISYILCVVLYTSALPSVSFVKQHTESVSV